MLCLALAASAVLGAPASRPSASPATRLSSRSDASVLASRPAFGLFEDLQYLSAPALAGRLAAYRATGVTWARFQVIWGTVQRDGPASYDWAPYDRLVSALVAHGLRPLAVITTAPGWARAAGCAQLTCAPRDPRTYAAFAAAAARRYAGRIAALELWNEPNSSVFYKPAPDPTHYAAMLKASYSRIKAVAPSMTVVTGGLAPAATARGRGWSTVAPLDFVSTMYRAGAAGAFDALGWHPYCYPALPGTADPGNAWYQMYGPRTSARSLMASHGDGSKRIWATEMGAHTDLMGQGGLSEPAQASTITRAVSLWSTYSWAGPMIVYQLRDRGTDRKDRENFFGLTRYDGSPKPSYVAFLRAVAAAGHRS